MVTFAFLGNTLFLTILVSMLSNTFSNISANAISEIHYRRAVLTLEGVKADAVFAYQPPFNILAVFIFLPLKFVVSPRWFHKIHVATIRFINLPLLLVIAVAERRLLWPVEQERKDNHGRRPNQRWFWHKWHLSSLRSTRAVFEVDPPEDVHQDIAVDDDMTQHLIRRQFTRSQTAEGIIKQLKQPTKKAARRDSLYTDDPSKLEGSVGRSEACANEMSKRLQDMERSMKRMELMLSRLLPDGGDVFEQDSDEDMGESSTLKGDSTTNESPHVSQDR